METVIKMIYRTLTKLSKRTRIVFFRGSFFIAFLHICSQEKENEIKQSIVPLETILKLNCLKAEIKSMRMT